MHGFGLVGLESASLGMWIDPGRFLHGS